MSRASPPTQTRSNAAPPQPAGHQGVILDTCLARACAITTEAPTERKSTLTCGI